SHLDIQLLGDFQLTHNGRSLNDLHSNRLQTLLVYLLYRSVTSYCQWGHR
ncbi:MAG: hypothetical protein IAF02_28745, partial [Anaerolineae bacterium]|nr:hypothetical protein [Anaerolineae bacterium]